VPDWLIGDIVICLVVHELTTNSIKYGAALSKAAVTVDAACIADDSDAVLTWKEQGGPAVAAPDALAFGGQPVPRLPTRRYHRVRLGRRRAWSHPAYEQSPLALVPFVWLAI
jgi:two-component sensor histidine kinase